MIDPGDIDNDRVRNFLEGTPPATQEEAQEVAGWLLHHEQSKHVIELLKSTEFAVRLQVGTAEAVATLHKVAVALFEAPYNDPAREGLRRATVDIDLATLPAEFFDSLEWAAQASNGDLACWTFTHAKPEQLEGLARFATACNAQEWELVEPQAPQAMATWLLDQGESKLLAQMLGATKVAVRLQVGTSGAAATLKAVAVELGKLKFDDPARQGLRRAEVCVELDKLSAEDIVTLQAAVQASSGDLEKRWTFSGVKEQQLSTRRCCNRCSSRLPGLCSTPPRARRKKPRSASWSPSGVSQRGQLRELAINEFRGIQIGTSSAAR